MRRLSTYMLLFVGACALVCGSCAHVPRGGPGGAVFYPPPPARPRLQYLTHFTTSQQVVKQRGGFAKLVLGGDAARDIVVKPYGVAINKGVIYVCDTKRNLINLFDIENKKFGYLGFEGRGKLLKPINIFIDRRGYKYVADAERGEIVVFDALSAFYDAFGGAELVKPVAVATRGDKVFVCDSKTNEIVVFDKNSQRYLYRFGGGGTGEGKFAKPTNIAIDSEGNLFLSDTINGRVQKVDPEGRHLQTFGKLGDRMGQFARPKGIALDREDRLYVVDAAFENVQIFDPDGQLLLFFSEAGGAPGQLNLPAQVVLDYDHVRYFRKYADRNFEIEYLVLVTSQYGPRKISVFGFGHEKAAIR